MAHLDSIQTYPLKSAASIDHDIVEVGKWGLSYDRNFAIVDLDENCITARTHPKIMHIQPKIENDQLYLSYQNKEIGIISLSASDQKQDLAFKIFSYDAYGAITKNENLTEFISNLIGAPCQIMKTSTHKKRHVMAKHGGESQDTLAFADQAPILLASMASLADLNDRTPHIIKMEQFRPNLIVANVESGEEDTWKRIQIGANVKLRLIQQCERCIFTTIDPQTLQKDPKGEPLRTLSKYRLNEKKNTVFGMHAVVEEGGKISKGDQITILE